MKKVSNTLVRFGDGSGGDRHQAFQDWLKAFPAGFYLNQKTATVAMLHTAHCKHYGETDWSSEIATGIISHIKTCAESVGELEAWAKTTGMLNQRCKDCAPDFQQELLDNYKRAGQETGYWGKRFLAEIKRKGGLATAKRMLQPSRSDSITAGWQALIDANQMKLSVESSAIKPEFRNLFTGAEVNEAQRRLDLLPDYLHNQKISPEKVFPDELPDGAEFIEGAKKQVMVNAYERNPQAREACLKKFGRRCSVCEMSFLERYGEIAKNFIHVHHKKPLAARAARRGEYKLNPMQDLIPVCPNCHAVLHMYDPPIGIEELKAIYRELDAECWIAICHPAMIGRSVYGARTTGKPPRPAERRDDKLYTPPTKGFASQLLGNRGHQKSGLWGH